VIQLPGAIRTWILIALTTATTACTAPQTRQLTSLWPEELPASAEISGVRFYPQRRFQCGPAALATVLSYRGFDVSATELVDEIFLPGREGSLRTEIVTAARARGLIAYRIPPTLRALLVELDAGRPVLVMQNLGLDWIPRWHFSVAVGYSHETGDIILRSGTIARHGIPFSTFEKTWARSDYWGLMVLKPDEVPVSAEPLEYLRAADALENRGNIVAAARAYETAVSRWPDNHLALVASGNAAFQLGEFTIAELAFRRAIDLQKGSVPAWNNLANTLAKRCCIDIARQAARCALKLSPENPDILETIGEVESLVIGMSSTCADIACPGAD